MQPLRNSLTALLLCLSARLYKTFSFNLLLGKACKKLTRQYMDLKLAVDIGSVEKCLLREYTSFFSPMEKSYYSNNVVFTDPLTQFTGIDKYQNNVDMLAGRTALGKLLFKDASINLHNIERLSNGQIQTRWTLRVTVKIIPWQPTARFSGVSIYTFDELGKISKQDDFWDSINLQGGKYSPVSFNEGLQDFLNQLGDETGGSLIITSNSTFIQ